MKRSAKAVALPLSRGAVAFVIRRCQLDRNPWEVKNGFRSTIQSSDLGVTRMSALFPQFSKRNRPSYEGVTFSARHCVSA